ncbi:MAG: glutathione S-transferase family protein [Halieaceae bacterium]|nr:glutathione S-transferase family protein [Halieaceae bacterium]
MKIYGDMISGNCYKVKLVAALLEIPHEWVHVDIMVGGARTKELLTLNPNGKVPTMELDDGRCLSESNAIINYLAFDTPLYPTDNYQRAKVQQWQFFEQYSHEPYIAVARFINRFQGIPEERKEEYHSKQNGGHYALKVMDDHLSSSPYFVSDTLTVADISLYAYTHVSHEGGFSLKHYSSIQAWLNRVSNHPRYVGME